MDDYFGVKNLVELIFHKNFKITEDMKKPGSTFPACLILNDFPEKLHHVMFARNVVLMGKWSAQFGSFTKEMLPTQESYLNTIIFACYNEHYCHPNIFDSFICLCSLVRFFCHQTSTEKGLNFFYMNAAITMAFFEHVMRDTFYRRGGFLRLLEYIREHKYNSWNFRLKDMMGHKDTPTHWGPKTDKNIQKEIDREFNILKSAYRNVSVLQENILFISQKVLLAITIEIPTYLRSQDSNQTVGATGLQDKVKTPEEKTPIPTDLNPFEKEVSQGSSGSKTIHVAAKQKEDRARCESIFQAVTRFNQSNTANLATSDSSTLKEAEEILERLRNSIKSLIEVLDEYDKE